MWMWMWCPDHRCHKKGYLSLSLTYYRGTLLCFFYILENWKIHLPNKTSVIILYWSFQPQTEVNLSSNYNSCFFQVRYPWNICRTRWLKQGNFFPLKYKRFFENISPESTDLLYLLTYGTCTLSRLKIIMKSLRSLWTLAPWERSSTKECMRILNNLRCIKYKYGTTLHIWIVLLKSLSFNFALDWFSCSMMHF